MTLSYKIDKIRDKKKKKSNEVCDVKGIEFNIYQLCNI